MKLSAPLVYSVVAAFAATFSSFAQAGLVTHASQLSLGDDLEDSSDDTLAFAPITWGEQDLSDGIPVYIYRNKFEFQGNQILPQISINNEFPQGFDTDIFILSGIQRAVERWNDVEGSEFQFRNPLYSDFAPIYDSTTLPFGPDSSRLDRYNLITFSDPNFNGSQTAVVYFPVYFYFNQDVDLGRGSSVIDLAELEISFVGGGEADVAVLEGLDTDLSLSLPRRRYDAGTIIDADVIFTTLPTQNYWILPENESQLSQVVPALTSASARGQYDVEALMTSALGRMAGLDQSQLFEPTLAPAYLSQGDDLDGIVIDPDLFLTDPFEYRTLELDDELTMAQAYPDGSQSNDGISGQLLEGLAFDNVLDDNDAVTEIGLPLQSIYLARPLGENEPITLDVLALGIDIREGLEAFEEINEGRMKLVASTFTGLPIVSARGPNSTEFEVSGNNGANGNYAFRGIDRRTNWYVLAAQPSFLPTSFNDAATLQDLFDTANVGNIFGSSVVPLVDFDLEADFEPEWFGGVQDAYLRYGRGNLGNGVVDLQDNDDSSIQNNFTKITLLESVNAPRIDADLDGAREITEIDPNGEIFAQITSGIVYLNPEGGEQKVIVRLVRESDGRVFDFPNTGQGFGGKPGTILEADDDLNFYEIQFTLTDTLNKPIGILTERIEITSYPTFTDIAPDQRNLERGFKVSYSFENISGQAYSFGLAHLYNPVIGFSTIGGLENTPVYVDGEEETTSTAYGRPNEASIPDSFDWYDSAYSPYFQFSILTNVSGSGITVPDRALSVNVTRAKILGNLWTIVPGETLENIQFGEDTEGEDFADPGVLLRFEPKLVPDSSTSVIVTGGTYIVDPGIVDEATRKLRDVENAFEPRDLITDTFADNRFDGFPLDTLTSATLRNVNIITNNGDLDAISGEADLDADLDGIIDPDDNCPYSSNPDQADSNLDGIGDICEDDFDNDGINDPLDNCVNIPNSNQSDVDNDGVGDLCDNDSDNDGIEDIFDNCPFLANVNQADTDNDGVGDVCETDFDGDGVPDETDNCPFSPNPSQLDTDSDGVGDSCDIDLDGDGINNTADNCQNVPNADQLDSDADGVGDVCEDGLITFNERSPASVPLNIAQIPVADLFVKAADAGDINGDGYADLVVGINALSDGSSLTNRIYINEGASRPGFFRDETFGANNVVGDRDDRLLLNNSVTQHVLLFDFDLDGDLDLFECNSDSPNRLLMNIDVDDPAVNPRPDSNAQGDGYFEDVSGEALPGFLNTKGSLFEGVGVTLCTRARAADIDSDGDLDLILAYADTALDLNGSSIESFTQRDDQGAIITLGPSFNSAGVRVSELLLINRRNELLRTVANGIGTERIPRGTPDAFVAFQSVDQTIRETVLTTELDPERGVNFKGFWFQDDTLGADGIANGRDLGFFIYDNTASLPSVQPGVEIDFDRMPILLEDFGPFPDTVSSAEAETDFSLTLDLATANFFPDSVGIDFRVADARLNGATIFLLDGYSPAYQNLDLNGDGLPDGVYYVRNFSNDFVHPSLIAVPNTGPQPPPDGDEDDITIFTDFSVTIVAADLFSQGYADFITVNQNGADNLSNGSASRAVVLSIQDSPFSGILRSLNGGVFQGSSSAYFEAVLNTLNPADGLFFPPQDYDDGNVTLIATPIGGLFETIGRTTHINAADFSRIGAPSLVYATDADTDVAFNVASASGGVIGLLQNIDGNGRTPNSWREVGTGALKPNPVRNYSFVLPFDADSDGDIDLFVGQGGGQPGLYINTLYSNDETPNLQIATDKPLFYDATREFLEDTFGIGVNQVGNVTNNYKGVDSSLETADIDRDGDMDIAIIAGSRETGSGDTSHIITNRGQNFVPGYSVFQPTFTGTPAGRLVNSGFPGFGLETIDQPGSKAEFFDFDNDGDEDLFVAYYGERNMLYENRDAFADDLFEESGESLNPDYVNHLTNYDVVDLRSSTDFPVPQLAVERLGDGIYERRSDRLPDLLGESLELTADVAIGDIDNDGDMDVYYANSLSNIGLPNVLMINETTVSNPSLNSYYSSRRFFEDSTRLPQIPLVSQGNALGVALDDTVEAVFLDADYDGDMDILNGNRVSEQGAQNDDLIESPTLYLNQGGLQGGVIGNFEFAPNFPPLDPQSGQPLKIRLSSIAVADFARRGDISEDLDGDGRVSQKEILIFENMIDSLAKNEFASSTVPVLSRTNDDQVQGYYVYPVTVLDRVDDEVSAQLIKRAPRYIDLNGNNIFNQSLDILFVTSEGRDIYLRNLGNDLDTLEPRYVVSPESFEENYILNITDVDVADVDLDGWLDYAVSFSIPDTNEASAGIFLNLSRQANGNPQSTNELDSPLFVLTNNEVPYPLTTAVGVQGPATGFLENPVPAIGDPHGNASSVLFIDADNDRDFDLMVGELGRNLGIRTQGALNNFYINRIIGAGFNAPLNRELIRVPGGNTIPAPAINITSLAPNSVALGVTKEIRIFGQGFKGGAQVSFGNGITIVSPPIVRSSGVIDVKIKVEPTATAGSRVVRVINPTGEADATSNGAFRVDLINPNASVKLDEWQMFAY